MTDKRSWIGDDPDGMRRIQPSNAPARDIPDRLALARIVCGDRVIATAYGDPRASMSLAAGSEGAELPRRPLPGRPVPPAPTLTVDCRCGGHVLDLAAVAGAVRAAALTPDARRGPLFRLDVEGVSLSR